MKEFELKYGCNPNQKPSRIFMNNASDLPIEILCGKPGYINFLDAFNSWQLVKELKEALGLPAVASFKHVSPTSAAVGIKLPEKLKKACFVDDIEQGRNTFEINRELLSNVVTKNKNIPDDAIRDLIISLITLKYTQSNSVCFAYDGQAIGVGAGQQSRIHCTRLAGGKADTWFLRQSDRVLNLPLLPTLGRPERDNVIDRYINKCEEDVCAEGNWQKYFTTRPEPLTESEVREYLDTVNGVSLGSDAFFPFSDNIERAKLSGVKYIAEPGGSIRDNLVIECADKYDMAIAFTGMRLFHH